MDEKERREALAAFLRTRRARLQPTEVGLPARKRRRTPGLRREEVAELANIGVSWYTLLEQGQDVHPSRQVLSSLSQALRLTATEERHLFLLASGEGSGKMMAEEEPIPPELQRVVDALDPHPAYLVGRCWNVLTWNRAADLVFRLHEPSRLTRTISSGVFFRAKSELSIKNGRSRRKPWWHYSVPITPALPAMPRFVKLLKTCNRPAHNFVSGGNNNRCTFHPMSYKLSSTQRWDG